MSAFLVDLQLLLWYASDPVRLPAEAVLQMRSEANTVYFSLASIWEASIRYALKRPDFNIPPQQLRQEFIRFGFLELPIEAEHVIAVSRLPFHHRDPFDRLLIAQAAAKGLTLMTTDKKMAQYGPFVQRF